MTARETIKDLIRYNSATYLMTLLAEAYEGFSEEANNSGDRDRRLARAKVCINAADQMIEINR